MILTRLLNGISEHYSPGTAWRIEELPRKTNTPVVSQKICQHLEAITGLTQPKEHVCEECVKIGSSWVHLRTCQTCGTTLCCDSSPNKHATKHAHSSGHPVVMSAEPGERWLWCYVDEQMAEY